MKELNSLDFHRVVFFTKVPLVGVYRYKNIFQMFPIILKNMPTSTFQTHFPNFLEFSTNSDDNVDFQLDFEANSTLQELFSRTARVHKKSEMILNLLSTFTNNLCFQYPAGEGAWGIPIISDRISEEMNSWSSSWCHFMFHFPELQREMVITEFSNPDLSTIPRGAYPEYYFVHPNMDSDKRNKIVFPVNIDNIFDSYFSQNIETKSIIDSAISFAVSAIELYNSRKTLSLLSSFTSLETMVNLEFGNDKNERCSNCGQMKYSVSKKFRNYMLKYIGSSDDLKRDFNDYYSIRSKIVHNGRKLKTEPLFNKLPPSERREEFLKRTTILQMNRLAITNWLLLNCKNREA